MMFSRWLALCGMLCWVAAGQAASLYLPVGDGRLRSDLQLLIDGGVLDLAVLAWPLPRSDVERALAAAQPSEDSPYGEVLARVRAAVTGNASSRGARLTGGHPGLLRDFETAGREDGNLSLWASVGAERWSATGVLSGVTDPDPGEDDHHPVRLDGSELTWRAGNWLLGPNLMDRWWGPGQQSSLILSNNARPIPALLLDRATSVPFRMRGLRWIGPWRFTAMLGRAEGSRQDVGHPYVMGMRLELRPRPWLEFAAQRTAIFCGEGRACGASVFWKMLLGHDNRGINTDGETEPGNGLAGFDLRVKLPGPLPLALYTQMIGEDVHDYMPVKYLGLFGAELGGLSDRGAAWRAHIEYSDTTCSFWRHTHGDPPPKFGCAYNSGVYPIDGYRYYRQSIGHSTDNDSRLWNLGWRYAPAAGGEWTLKVLKGDLNRGGDVLNRLAPVPTQYRALQLGWRADLGHAGTLGLQLGAQRLQPRGEARHTSAFGFLDWQRPL